MSDAARLSERVAALLDFPWEALEYLSWLRRTPGGGTGAYLFDQPELRFEPSDEDIIVGEPGLGVHADGSALRLVSSRISAGVSLAGMNAADVPAVRELLALFDGERCLAEVRALSRDRPALLSQLLRSAFGRLLFAPLAVAEAERAISGIEITRFPGSPYEISRAYWRNMGGVRKALGRLRAATRDSQRFKRLLCELHVIALMGENLDSYYQPQSPISGGRAAPGRLMSTGTRSVQRAHAGDTEQEPLHFVLSGPVVHAATVGGARYHELLYESLADPEAQRGRHFRDEAQLDWGRVLWAQTPADSAPKHWFCPPRPLSEPHFDGLRLSLQGAWAAAERKRRSECLAALAAFHQRFVRLHPFHCGNQCLAMNIANAVLVELLGAGIPHLMLDHLALRLSTTAYAVAFGRCVGAYLDARPNPAARYLALASSRTRTFELTRRIESAQSLAEARAIVANDEAGARLLLLLG